LAIPAALEKLNVDYWGEIHDFFERTCHHALSQSLEQFAEWQLRLETFLLDLCDHVFNFHKPSSVSGFAGLGVLFWPNPDTTRFREARDKRRAAARDGRIARESILNYSHSARLLPRRRVGREALRSPNLSPELIDRSLFNVPMIG
jgi:hypothetical protein